MIKLKYLFIALFLIVIQAAHAQTKVADTSYNHLLNAYFALKEALVADNSALANNKAKVFTEALKDVTTSQLNRKQKTSWLAYGEKLRFDGEHIAESTKIDHQREHFASLSKNILTVAKAFKANSMDIYEQYCPMKKQMWLSETTAIRNPYYGKEMENCGQTKTTLKAN